MRIDNEKEVKEYILDLEEDDGYEKIDILLNSYFNEVVSPLFNALYMLLKDYDNNRKKINYIVDLLKKIVFVAIEKEREDELVKISNLIRGLNYKISSNFSKKDKILINDISYEMGELFNSINNVNSHGRKLK